MCFRHVHCPLIGTVRGHDLCFTDIIFNILRYLRQAKVSLRQEYINKLFGFSEFSVLLAAPTHLLFCCQLCFLRNTVTESALCQTV